MTISGWQKFTITHNTMHDCGWFGFSASTDVAATPGAPSFGGIVGAVHSGSSVYYPFYGNVVSYNEIYNCGYETTVKGARIPGGAMATDFGCFYITGPQDGDGTNTANALQMSYNKVHDISAAAYPVLKWVGSGLAVVPHGYDAILDYHDGNDSNGVMEWNNLVLQQIGRRGGRSRLPDADNAAHSIMRSMFTNNIYASVFPAGISDLHELPAEVRLPCRTISIPEPTSNHTYAAGACSSTCYVMHNYNIYASTFTNARTTGNNTPPTCTSGVCVDGGVTWTFMERMPGTPYRQDYANITAWEVTGDAAGRHKRHRRRRPRYPAISAIRPAPEQSLFDGRKYSLTDYAGGYTFKSGWPRRARRAFWRMPARSTAPRRFPTRAGILPNFASLETGNFAFNASYSGPGKASACGGTGGVSPACALGFVPWDYNNVGAH